MEARSVILIELIADWFNQGKTMTIEDFDNLMTEAQREFDKEDMEDDDWGV